MPSSGSLLGIVSTIRFSSRMGCILSLVKSVSESSTASKSQLFSTSLKRVTAESLALYGGEVVGPALNKNLNCLGVGYVFV